MARISMRMESDITLTSRYECKYLISPELAPLVRQFVEPFVRPDRYAQHQPGFRYPICSLYLDTDDLQLYQQTVGGNKNRFKLRIRSYSDDPDKPVFAEVKRKLDSIVRKRRVALSRDHAKTLLRDGVNGWTGGYDASDVADAEFFAQHARLAQAKPIMKIRYLREAYESKGGDPVRITLDTDLCHAVTLDEDLTHRNGLWKVTPVDGVILEIKFTDRYPSWVHDLVTTFGLKQQPAPKYGWSVDHLLESGHASALTVGGFFAPPRSV